MTTCWDVAAVETGPETWVLLEATLLVLIVEVERAVLGDHALVDVVVDPIAD